MDMWDVLGIEETGDKDELKTAYRNKLRTVNPEDDQEGFMRLRKAYEEALKYIETSENESSKSVDRDERFPFEYSEDCYVKQDSIVSVLSGCTRNAAHS